MTSSDTELSPWQLFVFVLSVYALGAVAVEATLPLDAETTRTLLYVDTFVSLVFFADFVGNLIRSRDRLAYLKWGWLDLLSSVPAVQVLRWGRLARIVRVLRVVRGLRSAKVLFERLFADRAKGTLASVASASFLLVTFSALAILPLEAVPEANIRSGPEALWWAVVTFTTVGYGDFYPVTTAGRLLAAALMTAGIGLFGSLTAYLASLVTARGEAQTAQGEALLTEVRALRDEVAALRQQLDRRG
jgi:voltage-gated potassium channel